MLPLESFINHWILARKIVLNVGKDEEMINKNTVL